MTKTKKEQVFNPSEKIIAIQSEICGLKKDTNNTFFKSKYMTLGSIVNAIKPVLYKNDCYSTHKITLGENDKPYLITEIAYKDGTVLLSCSSPLPVKDVNDPQKLGSAITYMRRYNLTSLLEIEEDDDDGNNANQPGKPIKIKKITPEQLDKIQQLINKTDKSAADICTAYKLNSLADLLENQFEAVSTRLKAIVKPDENN